MRSIIVQEKRLDWSESTNTDYASLPARSQTEDRASTSYGPRCEKSWLCCLRTTKAQTSLRNLISGFVIRYLKSKVTIILKFWVKASGYAPLLNPFDWNSVKSLSIGRWASTLQSLLFKNAYAGVSWIWPEASKCTSIFCVSEQQRLWRWTVSKSKWVWPGLAIITFIYLYNFL